MSDLTSEELKQNHIEAVAKANTFRTHGVSEEEAKKYLKSPDGLKYLTRLNEAAPDASIDKLRERAIEQITSGRELPRMEMLDPRMPATTSPSSKYWHWRKTSAFVRRAIWSIPLALAWSPPPLFPIQNLRY